MNPFEVIQAARDSVPSVLQATLSDAAQLVSTYHSMACAVNQFLKIHCIIECAD